jgi:hypothetical protein
MRSWAGNGRESGTFPVNPYAGFIRFQGGLESSTGSSTRSTLALKLSAGHWTITATPSPG